MKFLSLFSIAIGSLLSGPGTAQVYTSIAQATGESEATLRFMRGDNAPAIAQETFFFRPDDWIIGRIRKGSSDFLNLTVPQSMDNIDFLEPDLAAELTAMAEKVGVEGAYRKQTEALLASAGFQGSDFDTAMADGNVVWNTGMDWANVMQTAIGDTHVLYIAFYTKHDVPERADNVPVDGALVALPVEGELFALPAFEAPKPERYFAFSESAEAFYQQANSVRDNSRVALYARCAQQFLLDAGFDPNGVDGAPGKGARAALAAWSKETDYPMPPFTLENAFYICRTLTARAEDFQKHEDGFVDVSSVPLGFGLNGADCASQTQDARSNPIAKHDGLYAHPVHLCQNGAVLTTLIYWSATNAEGTSLTTAIASPQGNPVPKNTGFDAATNSNFADVGLAINGSPVVCRILKPAGGIAPENTASCQ